MTFEFTIDLDGSPEEVWEFFDDPKNLGKWQPTLTNIELLEGELSEIGSVTRLTYNEGKKSIQLLETITDKRKPEFLSSSFVSMSGVVTNHMENYFETFFDQTTWRMVADFEFDSILMKIISPLLKPSIKKRTLADMERFKYVFESEKKTKLKAEANKKQAKKSKKKSKKAKSKKKKSK